MRYFIIRLFIFSVLCNSGVSYASCSGSCYDLYCGPSGSHGYCTDYILYRRGVKQSGDAKLWHGGGVNGGVKIGDVAIFDFGSYGHVAVVEGVDGSDIIISEWNFGGCSTSTCDLACGVTDDYKKTEVRSIPISSVTRFWRPEDRVVNNPDGGITYYHGDHTHIIQYNYRCSNNFCWEGSGNNWDLNCYDAHTWYEVSGSVYHNRTNSSHQTMRDSSMCAEVYADQPGMGGSGGGLPPVPGDTTDLTPDFDIYHVDGHEISSNHDDDPIGTVYVGQEIRLRLETEVHNDDVSNHLRDEDSDSIEGPIYYWIEGMIPKTLYVSEEFDVDDLDKNDEPDEEEWFTVPNYPGMILSFQAEVDGDDEINEESESNNTSRVERFLIQALVTNGAINTNYGSTDIDNPKIVLTALTEGHCITGTPTALLGAGTENNPWEWTCQGEDGGVDEVGYAIMAEAPTINLSGEWTMTANDFGFRTFFFQEGNLLDGYMIYNNDQKPENIYGTISGDQVTFYRDSSQLTVPQEYVTTYADDNSLSGDFSHNNQWGNTWSATRTATMGYVEDLSGVWQGAANGYEAIVSLLVTDNILTGTIKFDALDYTEDIKGVVDGDNFTFFRDSSQLVIPQEYQGTFNGGTSLNGFFSHDGLWNNYQFSFEKQ